MSKYEKGSERKYFVSVVACLIVVAIAVSAFIFSIFKSDKDDLLDFLVETIDGVPYVNPGPGMQTPDGPPNVSPPTYPPPEIL